MIVIVIVLILVAALAGIYLLLQSGRSLRRAASQLDKDWSDIELFVKQRNDDLPRLIQTCRSYMPVEHAALKGVTEARSAYQKAGSIEGKAAANARVAQALQNLFSEVAKYEGLKNNSAFVQLHSHLQEIDERIGERRDLFNDDVAQFNARLAGFPGRLMKGKLKARARFVADGSTTAAPSGRR